MKVNIKISIFFIIIIAFFISIDVYYYVPLLFILPLTLPIKTFKLSKKVTIYTLLIIVFLLLFLFNIDELRLNQPIFSILKYILLILLALFLSGFSDTRYISIFLSSLCIFILLNAYITIIYSYILFSTENMNVGYGFLLNPIHGVYTPSPKVALQMLFSTATLTIFFNTKNMLSFTIITIGLIFCLYIQSRTTFILLIFLFLLFVYKTLKLSKNTFMLTLVISMTLIITLLLMNDTLILYSQELGESRVTSSILGSKRYLHWADGVEKLFLNPLGNFTTDPNIEKVYFFHNIVLDSARIYGWLAIFLLSYFFIFTFNTVINTKNLNMLILLFIYILVLSQDVIIEGNFYLFLIVYIFTLILQKKLNSYEK